MPCTDGLRPLRRCTAALLALLLVGCASRPPSPAAPTPAPATSLRPAVVSPPAQAQAAPPGNATGRTAAAAAEHKTPPRFVKLGPPMTTRSWDELRLQVAQRLVSAHPDTSYVATPPSVLLAIPILEIELHADGSVRHIRVVRMPGQAPDTTQLAIDAVRRAAPFGDVSRLQKPWKFVEAFLFDDDRRFMPRTLDR